MAAKSGRATCISGLQERTVFSGYVYMHHPWRLNDQSLYQVARNSICGRKILELCLVQFYEVSNENDLT